MYVGYGPDLFEVDSTGTLPQVGVVIENTLAAVGVQEVPSHVTHACTKVLIKYTSECMRIIFVSCPMDFSI